MTEADLRLAANGLARSLCGNQETTRKIIRPSCGNDGIMKAYLLMLLSLSAGIYAVHTTVEWMNFATQVMLSSRGL